MRRDAVAARRVGRSEPRRASRCCRRSDAGLPVVEPMDEEQVQRIHNASMAILEEVGVVFRDPIALDDWKRAGAQVREDRVYPRPGPGDGADPHDPAQHHLPRPRPEEERRARRPQCHLRADDRCAIHARPRRRPARADDRRPRDLSQAGSHDARPCIPRRIISSSRWTSWSPTGTSTSPIPR